MAYRGRGRGRGRGGYNRGSHGKQQASELFPVIEGLGTAEDSDSKRQLIRWSMDLHKYFKSSPYYYEDRRERPKNAEKPDIERYSDRKSQTTKVKSQLRDFIMLDRDHIPAELAEAVRKKRKGVTEKIRWNPELGQDIFEKLEKMDQGEGEETEKKENEDDEEEDGENEEEEGEFSDEGDYEKNEDFDDDDDDANMDDDDNDEPLY